MSTYAVFDENGKNLGEGKTESDAIMAACETLATAGASDEWVKGRLVEWYRGDSTTSVCWLHPSWNGSHLTGVA